MRILLLILLSLACASSQSKADPKQVAAKAAADDLVAGQLSKLFARFNEQQRVVELRRKAVRRQKLHAIESLRNEIFLTFQIATTYSDESVSMLKFVRTQYFAPVSLDFRQHRRTITHAQ